MNVMAIGAHPDDIEFGCGGTLINHKDNGDVVIYVCMTDTQSVDKTTDKIIRSHQQLKDETQCAADVLGVDEIHYLPFKDLSVPFSLESVSELEKLIKEYEIDTIYTHWSGIVIKTISLHLKLRWLPQDMFQMYIVMNKYLSQDIQIIL